MVGKGLVEYQTNNGHQNCEFVEFPIFGKRVGHGYFLNSKIKNTYFYLTIENGKSNLNAFGKKRPAM